MKKSILSMMLMATVVLMISAGCDDGEEDTDNSDAESSTDTNSTDTADTSSVCYGNTEVRPVSDPLITDFDTLVTENWAADDTVAELLDEEGNTVFHWNNGVATSSTLMWPSAMVNTEDTSLCTDASAYAGIQLDMKGALSTTGVDYWGTDWTNTVSVGVVVAATYEVEWGGDALANCGHYFWPVSITPSWQTFTLNFADIQEPWNIAACPDVTSLPVEQVMGIGLSIDSTYTEFDIYVDNIAFK